MTFTFQGGKRRHLIDITGIAGNVVTNLSPGAGKRWLVLQGSVDLVCNVTAGNRYLHLTVWDAAGNNITCFPRNTTAITAGQSAYFDFRDRVSGLGVSSAPGDCHIGIGTVILEGDDILRITINGGLAGDSYVYKITIFEVDVT